jgi:hypothetical protein
MKQVRHSPGPSAGVLDQDAPCSAGSCPTILLGVLPYAYAIGEATAAVHRLACTSASSLRPGRARPGRSPRSTT